MSQLLVNQSRPTLCEPTGCSPPGSSVCGILQARILEWAAMPSSRGSFQPRDRTHTSCISCIAGTFFTPSAIWEASLPFKSNRSQVNGKMFIGDGNSSPVTSSLKIVIIYMDLLPHIGSLSTRVLIPKYILRPSCWGYLYRGN